VELPRVPFSDWELRPQDIKICMRPDGRKWEIGSGAFGQVCGITTSAPVPLPLLLLTTTNRRVEYATHPTASHTVSDAFARPPSAAVPFGGWQHHHGAPSPLGQ